MNHQQAQSFERLHAAATATTGNVAVQAEDVRNLLDATAHAYQTMEQMTRELAACRTRQIIDQDRSAAPPAAGNHPEGYGEAAIAPALALLKAVEPPDHRLIPTPPEAGS